MYIPKMMRYFALHRWAGIVVLFVLVAGQDILAQGVRDTLYLQLDEIQVTTTKSPRALSQVPARVSVLSFDDLAVMPTVTIDDHLRTISGVHVRRTSGLYTMRPSVSIRGLSGDEPGRTLVLLDGMPINTTDEGGVNWNSIPAHQIERIEVFKGPGSSLYGSNAMSGVIHILTRQPEKPLSVQARSSYGTYQTWKNTLSLSSRVTDQLALSMSGFYNTSDGYNPVPASSRHEPEYTYRIPRYLDEGGWRMDAAYQLSPKIEVRAGYEGFRDKRGEGIQIQADDGMYRNFHTDRFRGSIRGETAGIRYQWNVFYQKEDYFMINERMRGDQYTRFDVDSDRVDRGMSADVMFEAGRHHAVTAGMEARKGSVDGGDFYVTSADYVKNQGTMRFLAAYIQDEIRLADGFVHIQLGLRYDYVSFYDGFFEAEGAQVNDFAVYNGPLDENNWSTFSPRAGVRLNPSRFLSGYASYGRGFRASILDDLSRSGWMWVGPKVANPDLGPEVMDNIEAGLDIRPHWRWRISPTVYYSSGKDFLYYVATGEQLWGVRDIYRRENVSSVRLYGMELELLYVPSNDITLSAAYTATHSEIRSFPERPLLEGNRLTYAPRRQANASIQWRNPLFDSGLRFLYNGKQYVNDENTAEIDDYVTVDLLLSREVTGGFSLSLEIMDVFNNQHMENQFYLSPGRLVTVSVGYQW